MAEETAKRGIVYVITNPVLEGYVKIGMTVNLARRMGTLRSGVPFPFNCEYAAVVADKREVEKALHTAFGDYRIGREFFYGLEPFRAKAVLKLLKIEDVTPRSSGETLSEKVVSEVRLRNAKFKFAMARIPKGATLQWEDDPDIQCKVLDESHIEYAGKRTSLSRAACEIKGWSHANGTMYWTYEGETLQVRRERFERKAEEGEE